MTDWINSENLQWILIVAVLAVLLLLWPVLKFVQQVIAKTVLAVLVVALSIVLWTQRASLTDCAKNCECDFLGIEIEIPAEVKKRHSGCV